jgi:hypothetical protein
MSVYSRDETEGTFTGASGGWLVNPRGREEPCQQNVETDA